MKKWMLIFLCTLFISQESYSKKQRNQFEDDIVPVLVTGAIVVGSGAYYMYREPNEVKINRMLSWKSVYDHEVHGYIARVGDLADLQEFMQYLFSHERMLKTLSKETCNSYWEISSRYSWLKPWNWSDEMKVAYKKSKDLYQKMRVIEIMITYKEMITTWNNIVIEDKDVIKVAKRLHKGNSMYPLFYAKNMLRDDIEFLGEMEYVLPCSVFLETILRKMLDVVVGSEEYAQEWRMREEREREERKAKAMEEQARAEQVKAVAAMEKARAMHNRNDIEQEKLDRW